MEINPLIDRFFQDFQPGEEIRINSGEGYTCAIEYFGKKLEEVSDKAGISIVVGPIVSVDGIPGERENSNLYIRLAKEGRATLFCPPCRERFHYKVRSKDAVLKEDYHVPHAPLGERNEELIEDPLIVNSFIRDFDLSIKVFELEPITKDNWGNHFIYLKENEIGQLRDFLRKNPYPSMNPDLRYDFLTHDEIIELLKQAGVFREEMLGSYG
jgi:hypothetical protein